MIVQVLTTINSRPRNKALSSAERLLGTAIKTKKCSMQKHYLQASILQPESGWIFPGGGQVGSMYGTSSDMNVNIFGVENCPLTDSRTRKHVLLRE